MKEWYEDVVEWEGKKGEREREREREGKRRRNGTRREIKLIAQPVCSLCSLCSMRRRAKEA